MGVTINRQRPLSFLYHREMRICAFGRQNLDSTPFEQNNSTLRCILWKQKNLERTLIGEPETSSESFFPSKALLIVIQFLIKAATRCDPANAMV